MECVTLSQFLYITIGWDIVRTIIVFLGGFMVAKLTSKK